MKKSIFLTTVTLFCGAMLFAQTAEEIAKAAYNAVNEKTSSYTATLTLIDKAGKTRNREIACYTMKDGTTDKSVMVFRTPKDVAGVSYLSFDYPDAPDGKTVDSDSWLYLPAMKKVRRVSGSSKDDDFQGTDFTYDDLGNRSLGKDTFKILGEEKVGTVDCWILEYTAKDPKAKVSRRVLWLGKTNYIAYKGEYYDQKGKLQKQMTCENISQIDGYQTTKKTTMENIQTKHTTIYEVKDIVYDKGVDKNFFNVSALERELVK